MIWQNISAMSAPESADAPVNRPSMKKWVVLLVVLGALIGLGTMVKAWMDKRSGAAAQPGGFSGGRGGERPGFGDIIWVHQKPIPQVPKDMRP